MPGTGGRKRRRRQPESQASTASPSAPAAALPSLVTLAPAHLRSSSAQQVTRTTANANAIATTRDNSINERPHSTEPKHAAPQPLTDDSELQAQISILSQISVCGYGSIPGTPLSYGEKFPSSLRGASRRRHNGRTGNGARASTAGSTSWKREPWMGPMESNVIGQRSQSVQGPLVQASVILHFAC